MKEAYLCPVYFIMQKNTDHSGRIGSSENVSIYMASEDITQYIKSDGYGEHPWMLTLRRLTLLSGVHYRPKCLKFHG